MTYSGGIRASLPNVAEFAAGLGLNDAQKTVLSGCVDKYTGPRAAGELFITFDELVQVRGREEMQQALTMLTGRITEIFEEKAARETASPQERERIIKKSVNEFSCSILYVLITVRGLLHSLPTPFSFDLWQERGMGQTSYQMMQAKVIDHMHNQLRPHLQGVSPPSEMEKFMATLLTNC